MLNIQIQFQTEHFESTIILGTWDQNSNFQAAEDSSPIVAQIESTLCGTFGAGAWRRGPNLLMLTGVLKFQNFPQGGPRSLVTSRL